MKKEITSNDIGLSSIIYYVTPKGELHETSIRSIRKSDYDNINLIFRLNKVSFNLEAQKDTPIKNINYPIDGNHVFFDKKEAIKFAIVTNSNLINKSNCLINVLMTQLILDKN